MGLYTALSQTGRRMVGRMSRRRPGPLGRSGFAKSCWRAFARFWPALEFKSQRGTSSSRERFEEEYLSGIKRASCCGTSIANPNVIHETKSHPVISLLISLYHTAPRFGGRFPDSRKPSGTDRHSREV